jgi:protoporphyrinogen oxidase
MLYERIAAALPRPVQFHKTIVAIDPDAKRIVFDDATTSDYDDLVTTIPLTELVKIIDGCPEDVRAAASRLKSTEGLFVGIGVADPCPSTKCWMYFPGSDSPFYRVTYLSNYSPEMTPGPGHFSLLAEVSRSEHKPEDPGDVVERTIAGMVACQLLTPEQAADKIVSRELMHVPYSYPVPTIDRDAALAVIQPWLAARQIYSRGRFGAWRYEIGNTDHSVMMGVELADHLVNGAAELTWGLLPGEEARAVIA